jgi:hypothetical protein
MFSRFPMVAISRDLRKPGPTSMARPCFCPFAHRLALSSGVTVLNRFPFFLSRYIFTRQFTCLPRSIGLLFVITPAISALPASRSTASSLSLTVGTSTFSPSFPQDAAAPLAFNLFETGLHHSKLSLRRPS